MRHLTIALTVLACALPALALAIPTQLTQEGRLVDDATGEPMTGSHDATFSIHDAPRAGELLWSQTLTLTLDDDGYFVATLGDDANPLDASVFQSDDAWLELALDSGSPMEPRLPITSTPYAARAQIADAADALSEPLPFGSLEAIPEGLSDGDDDSLAQLSCGIGDAPRYDGTAWGCGPLANSGPSNCPAGTHAVGRLSDGSLDCSAPDFSDLTGVPPDLLDGDSDLLSSIVCGGGQRLVYDAIDGWQCADNISGSCGFSSILVGIRPNGTFDCVSFLSLASLINSSCPEGTYLTGLNGINPTCSLLPEPIGALDVLGLSAATPAESCADARASGLAVDGPAWLQRPGDPDPVQRHCMHSLEGGDWLMLESSTSAPYTRSFWRIPFAQRLDRFGRATPDANYYDGGLYSWVNASPRVAGRPVEILDVAEDLRGRRVVLVRADAAGFDVASMAFTSPAMLAGDPLVYDAHVAGGWSSYDQDLDTEPGVNCALTRSSTQHYGATCLVYSLGYDSDDASAHTGPHIERAAALRLGLFADADGSAHVPLRRLTRYIRY